jgi:CheY-like chemotaxis protein
MREAIRLLLCLEGHMVSQAESGRRACLMYAPGDFDLIITDLAMPDMKGDELASTIRCLVPTQRILLLAPCHQTSTPNLQVDAVVESPFKILELRRTIASLLASSAPNPAPPRHCPTGLGTPVK